MMTFEKQQKLLDFCRKNSLKEKDFFTLRGLENAGIFAKILSDKIKKDTNDII